MTTDLLRSTVGLTGSRYLEPAIETMAREELDALRERRLLDEIPSLYRRSALVRWAWDAAGVRPEDIRTLQDFKDGVPFMNKDTLRDFRDEFSDALSGLADEPDSRIWGAQSTSGTTSDPTLLPFFDRGSAERPASYAESFCRAYWELGVRAGDFVAISLFTFRGPVWANPQRLGATPVFFNHGSDELGRFLTVGAQLRPTAVFLLSQAMIFEIADRPELNSPGVRDWLRSTRFIYGGEPLGTRAAQIAQDLGMQIYQHTAAGDVAVATECLERDGCHVPEDQLYLEHLVPGSSDSVSEGELGEMVVTAIDGSIPLVRYRSDDLVRVDWDRCGCGRSHARIWPVGRVTDGVVVGNVRVLPADVWSCVEQVPESRNGIFQIVTGGPADRLTVRVGILDGGQRAAHQISDQLVSTIAAAVGVEVSIELVSESELLRLGPPHKIPRIVKA